MTDKLERTTREREQFVRELASLNQTLEAKIAERTDELETAVKAQQRLLGDISHEIKSPLARLSMAMGLASRYTDADRARQFARMEHEIETIAALAGELLTLARLDAATVPPKFEMIELREVLREIVDDVSYETPERQPDILFSEMSHPPSLRGNRDLLRRAIENVVRNAIFYTAAGTTVEIALSTEPPHDVVIEVRDQGPGVPDSALPHLFEPFYRVDEARARATGGTGIGLAICQRVVQLHGGWVSARKNHPQGLVVQLTLPAQRSSAANIDDPAQHQFDARAL